VRFLIDVDGPVANLMDGFATFFWNVTSERLDPFRSSTHRISQSPELADLHARFDLDALLTEFLSIRDVYQRFVPLTHGAWESIHDLLELGHEVGFVTATLKTAPSSYASKLLWLRDIFPDVPMLAVAADQKHWVTGDYAIDDRYDTCLRWRLEGVTPLLFRLPWNEAPPNEPSYDWKEIMKAVSDGV